MIDLIPTGTSFLIESQYSLFVLGGKLSRHLAQKILPDRILASSRMLGWVLFHYISNLAICPARLLRGSSSCAVRVPNLFKNSHRKGPSPNLLAFLHDVTGLTHLRGLDATYPSHILFLSLSHSRSAGLGRKYVKESERTSIMTTFGSRAYFQGALCCSIL